MKRLSVISFISILLFYTLVLSFFSMIPCVKATETSSFYPSSDGDARYFGGFGTETYDEVHDALVGTSSTDSNGYMFIGQDYYFSASYRIWRSCIRFDTSTLPDDATITAAKLCLYGDTDQSTTNFDIRIEGWTEAPEITATDYDGFDDIQYDDGNFNTATFTTSGYNNITFSTFTIISLTGNTDLSIRSGEDIGEGNAPTDKEYVMVSTVEVFGLEKPILEVEYSTPPDIIPSYSDVEHSTTLANTSCLISSNWTADTIYSPPTENMSHWIFGSNMSGTWENATYPFPPNEELLDSHTYSGGTLDQTIYKLHPSGGSYISGLGQSFTIRPNSKDVFSSWNITSLRVRLKKSGSPTCNISAVLGVGSGVYGSSWVLDDDWGNVNSTTIINATTLTTSYVWYWLNFSEPLVVTSNQYYGWGIVGWGVGSTLDPSNHIYVDSYGMPSSFDGNPSNYKLSVWVQEIRDLRFFVYGVPSNCDDTWANVTCNLPAIVGLTIAYQFSANNTNSTGYGGYWNTTGLLFLVTTGWNLTFYYTYGGTFKVDWETKSNGTTTGYPNSSMVELGALPQNSSYIFLNFTYDSSNSLTNPHNITNIQSNFMVWCYFEPVEVIYSVGAYGLLAIFILVPIIAVAAILWRKR